MRPCARTTRFGLTVVELMLALSITVIMGAAITAMLRAVSVGVETNRDSRSHMLQANAAQMRLSAYIAPSLCVLGADGVNLTLWFKDARRSATVHSTELRWLRFDESSGTLSAYAVAYPSQWTETQKLIVEREYAATTDWEVVFTTYEGNGWLHEIPLVDGLNGASLSLDHSDPQEARHVTYRLTTSDANVATLVSASLRVHRKPQ